MDILAENTASFVTLLSQLGHIFYYTVLPILLVASVGFVIQKKAGLDSATMTRLNFYFAVPAMVYFSVVTSKVNLSDVATVVKFCLCVQAISVIITISAARLRKISAEKIRAMLMATMFYNSGNFGLPLQQLAFRQSGHGAFASSIQVFVMLFQNVLSFTVGVFIVSGGGKSNDWRKQLKHILGFPPLYALIAAIITVKMRIVLADKAPTVAESLQPFWQAIVYSKNGFFAIALVTLGLQLANVSRNAPKYPVKMTVLLRLLIGPAIGLAAVYFMNLRGLNAQVLLISTTSPTAVNAMLLCMQFDKHPEFVARSVLYSTLLAPITVTVVIFIAQCGLLERLTLSQADLALSQNSNTTQIEQGSHK